MAGANGAADWATRGRSRSICGAIGGVISGGLDGWRGGGDGGEERGGSKEGRGEDYRRKKKRRFIFGLFYPKVLPIFDRATPHTPLSLTTHHCCLAFFHNFSLGEGEVLCGRRPGLFAVLGYPGLYIGSVEAAIRVHRSASGRLGFCARGEMGDCRISAVGCIGSRVERQPVRVAVILP